MTATGLIVASGLRGTLILICGIAGAMVLRRASAAVRHSVWVATLAALIVLPAALWLAPSWTVPIATSAPAVIVETAPGAVTIATEARQPAGWSWAGSLSVAWLLGTMASASWFLIGAARISRIRYGCRPVSNGEATVLEGAAVPVPAVCGLWRPVILLPLAARDWPAEQVRSVLLHEKTHIRRGDLWVQLLVQAVCSLYWFHPLVWLAARALRKERERACDDAVLRAGIPAPEYAGHLIELARGLAGRQRHVLAMADGSGLETRVRALLDRRHNRQPLSIRGAAGIACAFLVVLLPMATVRGEARLPARALAAPPPIGAPAAAQRSAIEPLPVPRPKPRLLAQAPVGGRSPQPPQPQIVPLPRTPFVTKQVPTVDGKMSGVVFDPSGARVPGCHVIARNLDGPTTVMGTTTDASGAYKFDILPGRYLLEFDEPGFHPYLVMAQQQPQNIWLTVGSTFFHSEVVGGQKPAIVGVAPQPGAPRRIKVGGNVQPAQLIAKPEPTYPPELQQLGIEGSVSIRAIISKTGEPTNLQVVNTDTDPRFAQAALNSVAQWRYQPTLLNGEPVEIETTITVDFKLQP